MNPNEFAAAAAADGGVPPGPNANDPPETPQAEDTAPVIPGSGSDVGDTSPAPAAAPQAPAEPEKPGQPPGQKAIPHEALHMRLERLRQQRQQDEQRINDLTQRLEQMQKGAAKPEPQPGDDDPKPNVDEDMIGFLKWQYRETERQAKAQAQERQAQERDREAQARADAVTQQQWQVIAEYGRQAEEYRLEEPSFDDAYAYYRHNRARELAYYAPNATPQQINAYMQREEFDATVAALQAGLNPAQALYQAALHRGFRSSGGEPAPAQASAVEPPRDPGTGQFVAQQAAPARAAQPAQQPTRQPPRSMAALPGKPGGQTGVGAIAEMDMDDFDARMGDDITATWRQMHGKRR
jgi:hypothetical protein